MRASEIPGELVDRGIYWQIAGFAVFACASVTILAEFVGSDSRAFLYFEIAVTKLYWALIIPLAGLFDGGRKLFEKMSDIKAKRKQRWLDEGRREGRQEGRRLERERMRRELEELGVTLPREAMELLNETDQAGQ